MEINKTTDHVLNYHASCLPLAVWANSHNLVPILLQNSVMSVCVLSSLVQWSNCPGSDLNHFTYLPNSILSICHAGLVGADSCLIPLLPGPSALRAVRLV